MIHTPWSENLGAPQALIELRKEWLKLGHYVEKYSLEDAFPARLRWTGRGGAYRRLLATIMQNRSFAKRARRFVAANAGRFDVIDASHTDLPYPKDALNFRGLLVARSVGLVPLYREFELEARRRWPESFSLSALVHQALSFPARRRCLRDSHRSLQAADLVNVANTGEARYARESLGLGSRVTLLPLGLSDERLKALRSAALPARDRLAFGTVAFVGTWNPRKGSRDWPAIVAAVRQRVPAAKFLFLGTSLDQYSIRMDFPEDLRDAITVIPHYDNQQLPQLLAGATVGAFPGYLEGWGLGVLEMLAAGLPTVAYDSPGPRDILGALDRPELVPTGDHAELAARVSRSLQSTASEYRQQANDSFRAASEFCWTGIAKQTLTIYQQTLAVMTDRLGDTRAPAGPFGGRE